MYVYIYIYNIYIYIHIQNIVLYLEKKHVLYYVILYIYSILSLYQSSPEVGISGKACYIGGELLQSTSAAHDSGEG